VLSRRQFLGGQPAHIASAIVRAVPGCSHILRGKLANLPGVEIHAEAPEGRFIVTVEDTGTTSAGDTIIEIHRIEEVLTAALVSQYEIE
jgi:periplasmic nitrate reductase NapD